MILFCKYDTLLFFHKPIIRRRCLAIGAPDSRKFIPVPCTITFAITCYTEIMKRNLSHIQEALRQIGIILVAGGLLVSIFKDDAILAAVGLAVAGLVLIWVGALERS